jgi:hypothetical protein
VGHQRPYPYMLPLGLMGFDYKVAPVANRAGLEGEG